MRYIKIEDLLVFRSRWGQGDTLWKNSVLKKDFRDFFHNKCWYTEVPLVGQDVHIDHFRPKAEVKPFENFKYNHLIQDKGYYWLAMIRRIIGRAVSMLIERLVAAVKEIIFLWQMMAYINRKR